MRISAKVDIEKLAIENSAIDIKTLSKDRLRRALLDKIERHIEYREALNPNYSYESVVAEIIIFRVSDFKKIIDSIKGTYSSSEKERTINICNILNQL